MLNLPYRNYKVCPYCNGTGGKIVAGKQYELGYGEKRCLCTLADIVNFKHPILKTVSDPIVEDVTSIGNKFRVIIDNEIQFKNSIFFGDIRKFLYLFKTLYIAYHDIIKNKFELLEALQIVHNYHVEQVDGSDKDIYTLNVFNLVGITFINETENKAMDKTVHDTIQNRYLMRRGTWIYAKSLMDLKKHKACNEGTLKLLLEDKAFSVYDLDDPKYFSYKGFEDMSESSIKKASDLNRNVAKMFS